MPTKLHLPGKPPMPAKKRIQSLTRTCSMLSQRPPGYLLYQTLPSPRHYLTSTNFHSIFSMDLTQYRTYRHLRKCRITFSHNHTIIPVGRINMTTIVCTYLHLHRLFTNHLECSIATWLIIHQCRRQRNWRMGSQSISTAWFLLGRNMLSSGHSLVHLRWYPHKGHR